MNDQPAGSLAQDLLMALAADPVRARSWLPPVLGALREATGGGMAYLGEAKGRGFLRHATAGGALVIRRHRRLHGIARRLMAGEPARVVPEIGRGSGFRPSYDGWDGFRARSYAGVPLPEPWAGRAWLAIVSGAGDKPLDSSCLPLLDLAARAAATAMTNEARWRDLETLSMTDALTRIPNYRFLRLAVEREIARSCRQNQPFTVVMADVDNLKRYNGAHGHLAGSEILKDLAQILKESLRRYDHVAKYGGDEFLLILPRTRPVGGMLLSERVRDRIAERLRGIGGEVLSCSFGVAGFPENGDDYESLVRAADRALYRAKEGGRDAVVCLAPSADTEERRKAA